MLATFAAPDLWEFRMRATYRLSGLLMPGQFVSATLECEADPTLENEATGSVVFVCRVLGSDAGQGVDPAVA